MSLQRRLLLYLLIGAPIVWLVAGVVSLRLSRNEIDELFDTELVRLARQMQVTLYAQIEGAAAVPLPPRPSRGPGRVDLRDLAIAMWSRDGSLRFADREGVGLPYRPAENGFVDMKLGKDDWRVYYQASEDGAWLVAAGQRAHEREELAYGVTLSQVLPWLAMLPLLLVAMTWGVRRALAPVRSLSTELAGRGEHDLRPVEPLQTAAELRPLVEAMNGLLSRIGATLARERRFTADAAHELRTPLAVLRAQWDVLRRTEPGPARAQAEARLTLGLDRMDRLVEQLLALSRLESGGNAVAKQPVDWPAVVEQAMNDCLPLAERRRIELACDWAQPEGCAPLPLRGDASLLAVMLRNLLDNAVRYAPPGSTVLLRFDDTSLSVDNDAEPLDEERFARLGERFYRPDGQDETGSGLGLSIVQRIAALHGLAVRFARRDDGRGLRVVVGP